jgi:formylglycine-generating enzyme required for sulfatase activity
VQAAIYTMLLGIIAGLVAFINQEFLKEQYHWRLVMGPSVLTAEQEREKAAKPGSDFKECANGCPTMIVVPDGRFMMGSPEAEGRHPNEGPRHEVTIAKPFAVGKTDVTFAEWDICVAARACPKVFDTGWGRGNRPVIWVNWEEAKGYVTWLSRMTGKDYRLLSEAEWEYSARAGNQGRWSFGDDEAQLGDYAWFSENSDSKTQLVAKKKPNAFGLYDMHGNVFQWVEDPYHHNYNGAPLDGSEWGSGGDASRRVVRGGSWNYGPDGLRSAKRDMGIAHDRNYDVGFRVGRTLTP